MDEVAMSTIMGVHGFQQAEDVWQLKWPPVTHLASNWQPTFLACEVSHNNQFWRARWLQLSQKTLCAHRDLVHRAILVACVHDSCP